MTAARDTSSKSPAQTVLWTPWGPQKPAERDAQRKAIRRLVIAVERLAPQKTQRSLQ